MMRSPPKPLDDGLWLVCLPDRVLHGLEIRAGAVAHVLVLEDTRIVPLELVEPPVVSCWKRGYIIRYATMGPAGKRRTFAFAALPDEDGTLSGAAVLPEPYELDDAIKPVDLVRVAKGWTLEKLRAGVRQ